MDPTATVNTMTTTNDYNQWLELNDAYLTWVRNGGFKVNNQHYQQACDNGQRIAPKGTLIF